MLSGQEYASRLREETRRTLASHLKTLEEDLRSFQNNCSTSIAHLARNLGLAHDVEMPALEAILAEAVHSAERQKEHLRDQEMLHLARFAHDMRQKETQDEILNFLLDGAQRYAPRLVLFVTRGNQFLGWAVRGFADDTGQRLAKFTIPISESALLRGALDADGLITANDLSKDTHLAQVLREGAQGPWHAFPMKAIRRPVAVLLVSPAAGQKCDLESLCVLMDVTGLCIENIALKILQDMRPTKPAAVVLPQPQPDGRLSAAEVSIADQHEAPAADVEIATTVAAVAQAPAPAASAIEAPIELPVSAPADEPLPTPAVLPETAIAAEAKLDEEASQPMAAAEAAPQPQAQETAQALEAALAPRPGVAEAAKSAVLKEVQPLTEEEKLHADAKRFARLLASEIKLYNEQRVVEGRSNKDLYVRLKRDIDRSRDMYEKRVSSVVSKKVDYFHDEVIRILGDNDPSTLGSDYPGPRVEG